VAELGERILTELSDSHTNNILVRWLAHHTARLVQAADTARAADAPDADAREAAARDAILRLWQARSAWPSGWPPPHAAVVARLFDGLPALDSDTGGWHHPTVLSQLQGLHLHILSALIDLATAADDNIEAGWLDRFGDQLSADEATILRRVADRQRRVDALEAWQGHVSDGTPETVEAADATHPLLDLVNAYRQAIIGLLNRSIRAEDDGERDRTVDDQEMRSP
jgi:hypothetical protein